LASFQDRVYTGLHDGRIIEVLADSFKTVTTLDLENLGYKQCGRLSNMGKCARPLGLRFDSRGTLYALDPFYGLWSVNVTTGQAEVIASKEYLNNALFLDDLVIIEKPNGHKGE